ncbi:YolD-like family protein [Staphylococcus saprophyticus]|uniref:YolD-like family protein n=1 Tax=Staphylococcus saprophyticus TaxID=29385 RepID=UPI00157C079F|nr:YolD-like family protein [Staphylococcus saprophyticus]MDW4148516.1 YolD-like family protein [Staphylococcus saprophyticus]QKQ32189.1 YolD-like family protein [Staphylococcus saprophyticus]
MKVVNPDAPDEYKYETDYREIPREYLNPKIPQGRGIVKWQAFKTLPEQYEQLEQYIQDQNKIDRPSLSDDQLNDLNEKLIFKMYHDPAIELRYFADGYIQTKDGYIHKVDVHTQILHLYEGTELSKVNLLDIVEIK